MLEAPNFLPDSMLEDFWKKTKNRKRNRVKEAKWGGGGKLFSMDELSLKHLPSVKLLGEGKLGCDMPY